MNLIAKMFGGSYDDLWKAVIRPPRDEYLDADLGPEKFNIKGKNYKRTDFTIQNNRNYKLQCSYWEPYDEEREYDRLPCVVYLHGNSSSRAEAVTEAKILLPMNVTLFAFDFTGCGRSEGDYISLGWYEREDVECVIEFLRKSNKVSTIGLWGRSMGAVTAIMYGDRDPSIAGMVLDSPFSSLKMLVEELVKDKVSLPNFILNQALSLVKSTVVKKAKFKLEDIEPINYAQRCFIPALFVAAKSDNFVKPHHSQILHDSYPGDKNLVNIDGDHNSARPRFFKDSAAIFFYNTLQVQFIKDISDNYAGFTYNIKKDDADQIGEKRESEETVKTVENDKNIHFNNSDFNFISHKILYENAENSGPIPHDDLRVSSENNEIKINKDEGKEIKINFTEDKLNYYDILEDEEELFNKILEMSKHEYETNIGQKPNLEDNLNKKHENAQNETDIDSNKLPQDPQNTCKVSSTSNSKKDLIRIDNKENEQIVNIENEINK